MPLKPPRDWKDKLRESARDFLEVVWPQIRNWFGNGELIPVEAVTESEMAKCLDRNAGIDAWYIETENGIRGIASRVQWGKDWKTFTVRIKTVFGSRTEYQKLSNAIKNDWLYPYWFVQAYLTESKKLLNVARCKTKDLIEYIDINKHELEDKILVARRGRPNPFCPVEWAMFRQDYPIDIFYDVVEPEHQFTLVDFMARRTS